MQKKQAALSFILITILLDMLGIGIIVPVLPKLVTSLYGSDLSHGSYIFGWFVASYALMQFIFSPILGNLSDAYGRRPIILGSLFGAGIDYLVMAFAPTLSWLFVGRIISGITGANITAANAYVADVSAPEDRAKNFGMIGACFGVGFIIGPIVGGVLGYYGLKWPFIAAAVLNLCNAIYGYFILPESHPKENRRAFDWSRVNPMASLTALKQYPVVLGLAATLFIERTAHDVFPATWVLFTTYRFNWNELDTGISLAVVGIAFAIVSALLTGPIVKKFGERNCLIFGLIIGAVAFLLYGLATQGWMMYAIIISSSIGGVSGPSLQAIITRLIPSNEQGAVQGALNSLQSVATIIGPLIATNLFGYFTSEAAPVKIPGAAFLASSLLVAIAAIMAIRSSRKQALEIR